MDELLLPVGEGSGESSPAKRGKTDSAAPPRSSRTAVIVASLIGLGEIGVPPFILSSLDTSKPNPLGPTPPRNILRYLLRRIAYLAADDMRVCDLPGDDFYGLL